MNISIYPSDDAARLGYDQRQINRITIRMAQFFLSREMRVIFGQDWRNDGVMQAVANFAQKVAPLTEKLDANGQPLASERMLNMVAEPRASLSRAATTAARNSDGVLKVMTAREAAADASESVRKYVRSCTDEEQNSDANKLTELRHYLTAALDPGCRICLGGRTSEYEDNEPGIVEEARLALAYRKPLYLLGGFGGATREFGEPSENLYWDSPNGLDQEMKRELFETLDIDRAVRIVAHGIKGCQPHP